MITIVVVIVISITALATLGKSLVREVMTRNDQYRLMALSAASSEIGAHVRTLNSNAPDADDVLILDLVSTVGVDREFELEMGTPAHPILTGQGHAQVNGVQIDGEIVTNMACPGSSIGSVNVLLGTLHAQSSVADTGVVSSQQQHFLYCWP
ncbi:MAG: hypothetical protein AAF499_17985 [Pseudomonadota bacterium]